MSELTERLRNVYPPNSGWAETAAEAADEIDRLNATLEAVQESRRGLWVEHEKLTAELAQAMAALRELVACEDMMERYRAISPIEPGCEREFLREDYRKRNPLAWSAARALVRQETKL